MSKEKYGFVYIWYDRKHKCYYIGCRWGTEDDGYICSSNWMRRSYHRRPQDFKRRIISRVYTNRQDLLEEEYRYLQMIKENEIKPYNDKPRYYNLHLINKHPWHSSEDGIKTIGQKISKAKKGKKTGPRPEYVKQQISATKLANNIKFTDEHKQKLRNVKLGNSLTEEHKSKISASLLNSKRYSHTPTQNITKQLLIELYVNNPKASLQSVANKLNVSDTTIQRYMSKYNIPRRSRKKQITK